MTTRRLSHLYRERIWSQVIAILRQELDSMVRVIFSQQHSLRTSASSAVGIFLTAEDAEERRGLVAAKGCAVLAALAFLLVAGARANAQAAQTSTNGQIVERGKFRFFDTKQPQGEESYEITREGRELVLKTTLELESEDKISLPRR